MYQITQFLKFYFSSLSKYRIHSPFVFEICEDVIEDHRNFYAFDEIEHIRHLLKNQDLNIPKFDKGAGSKKLGKKSKADSIKDIISTSVSNPYKSRVLFRLVEHLALKHGLELGSSVGISTAYLAKACNPGQLYSIEANAHLANIAQSVQRSLKSTNCTIVNNEFDQILEEYLKKLPRLDFAFIDGNHSYKASLNYFQRILPYVHDKTVLIFDDIYWSEEMTKAWRIINSHKKVSLSLDLFYFGIVFFTPDFKEKQSFKLRSPLKKILFA
jgi:predicted O-methyltransferase YrrM